MGNQYDNFNNWGLRFNIHSNMVNNRNNYKNSLTQVA